MGCDLSKQIQQELRNLNEPDKEILPLPESEISEALDNIMLFDSEVMREVLPRIIVYIVRCLENGVVDEFRVWDITCELDVERASWYQNSIRSTRDRESMLALESIRQDRSKVYACFTPDQARAIVSFLDLIRDKQPFNDGHWEAARRYWSNRASKNNGTPLS